MSIWFAVSPRGKGPTEAIVTFALAAAVAVLGLKRTGVAGMLLLVVGIVPFLVSSLGRGHVLSSLAAVSFVPAVTGILYLLSASIKAASQRRQRAQTTDQGNCRKRPDRPSPVGPRMPQQDRRSRSRQMAQTMKTACPSEENDKPGRAAASAGRPCLMA